MNPANYELNDQTFLQVMQCMEGPLLEEYKQFLTCADEKMIKRTRCALFHNEVLQQHLAMKPQQRQLKKIEAVGTSTPFCGNCIETAQKLQRCSGCKIAYYCSTDCQRAHWKEHKSFCVKYIAKKVNI